MTQTKAELLQTRHQGDIRLGDADSTHYVGFKAPATVGTSLVWTLPAVDGTANYLLKTDGSGNLGWVADSSTDSTKMPLAGGIFTGNVTYNDSIEARFGTGADLKIFHSGSESFIRCATTAAPLYIDCTENLHIRHLDTNGSNSETMIKATGDGGVELYHDNVKTFQTEANGILVRGPEGGNSIAYFYADEGDDLADKWTVEATTNGKFTINYLNDSSAWEKSIECNRDGTTHLFHNNVNRLNTTAAGIEITGVTATDPSAVIYHSNADVEGEWLRLGRTDLGTIRYHSLKAKHGGGASSNQISCFLHNGSSTTSQTEIIRLLGTGAVGFGGANYGTSGQVLTSGGSSAVPTWADAAGGGATPTVKTANYTAASGDMVVVNGTGLTITLPSSPSTGDSVAIRILGDRYATIARNSSNIEGSATNYYVDIFDGYATFTYSDSTRGWLIGG
tara:strand:+ start:221 stop:1567 length:1347 start_codon:yes stop_codon:yes gene_type:complete